MVWPNCLLPLHKEIKFINKLHEYKLKHRQPLSAQNLRHSLPNSHSSLLTFSLSLEIIYKTTYLQSPMV